MIVKCPQCKKKTKYSKENQFRPFCSEKCYLIDLGAWFEESYKIEDKENTVSQPEEQ